MPILASRLGGMTTYIFIKQALRLRLVRVTRAAASARGGPLFACAHSRAIRRLLPENIRKALQPPKINFARNPSSANGKLRTKNNGIPRGKMRGNLLLHSLIVIFAP